MRVTAISDLKYVPRRNASTYQNAGVDIDAGDAFVKRIRPHAESTNRTGIVSDLGGYGGLFDLKNAGYKDPILVSATDGVGTKLLIAHETNTHGTIGIDLVAMCVNDLIVQAAEPLFFLDYFATGKLNPEAAEQVVEGIADGCRQAGCALIGGETAEMPGMYLPGHYDLAGFAVGAVERKTLLPRDDIQAKDVILGLPSDGLHSNGFSLIRKIIQETGLDFNGASPFEEKKSLVESLLTPTRIYVNSCLSTIKIGDVKALAHITGGGLIENVPRILPEDLGAKFFAKSWHIPPVFKWLANAGRVPPREMARTFNCGIGMVLVVSSDKANPAIDCLHEYGEPATLIGEICEVRENTPRINIIGLEDVFI